MSAQEAAEQRLQTLQAPVPLGTGGHGPRCAKQEGCKRGARPGSLVVGCQQTLNNVAVAVMRETWEGTAAAGPFTGGCIPCLASVNLVLVGLHLRVSSTQEMRRSGRAFDPSTYSLKS